MKRFCTLLLAACLALSLAVPAAAAAAQPSPQTLKVNGETVSCAAYNIDGNNYYKLRDIALLLRGTDARFSVSAVDSARIVSAVRGGTYVPEGSELSASAAAAAYVRSAWKLRVDGSLVSCTVYNIDGYNYFKLRDLGNALRFAVDYDAASGSVLVTAAKTDAAYAPDIVFSTAGTDGNTWTDACFKGHKLTMLNYWAYWCSPCCRELPALQKLEDTYGGKGLQVLGVSAADDLTDDLDTLKKLGITYPTLTYVSAFDASLNTGYLPTTVFVDQNGRIVGQAYVGGRSYDDWSAIVASLLP